jgi:hypothetical protein
MKSVNIDGKSYPVIFGADALVLALEKYELKTIDDTQLLFQRLEVSYMPEFLFLGTENAAKVLKKEGPTLEQIKAEFNVNLKLMQKTLEIFAHDLGGDDEADESEKKEEPKKEKPLAYKK